MKLRNNFKDKVAGGKELYTMLCSTATGTGLGATSASNHYKIGMCVLDRSSLNWFMCTVTAGSGTWVQINA